MCCTAEPKAYTKDFRSLNLWSTYMSTVAKTTQTAGKKNKDNAVDNSGDKLMVWQKCALPSNEGTHVESFGNNKKTLN
jgi:hypothetical protein